MILANLYPHPGYFAELWQAGNALAAALVVPLVVVGIVVSAFLAPTRKDREGGDE